MFGHVVFPKILAKVLAVYFGCYRIFFTEFANTVLSASL